MNIFSESESVQASDANQNIIERLTNLQKQINELRRQIATLPGGGETKDLVSEVVTVPANTHDVSNQIHEGTALRVFQGGEVSVFSVFAICAGLE